MKNGKAARLSGVVLKIVKVAGEAEVDIINDLVKQIRVGVIPVEWKLSTTVNWYKGKGVVLERGNYRGMKLTDQILKVAERVDKATGGHWMGFGFMPRCGITNAIFILGQLQEK